jgi:hypothetical protein
MRAPVREASLSVFLAGVRRWNVVRGSRGYRTAIRGEEPVLRLMGAGWIARAWAFENRGVTPNFRRGCCVPRAAERPQEPSRAIRAGVADEDACAKQIADHHDQGDRPRWRDPR